MSIDRRTTLLGLTGSVVTALSGCNSEPKPSATSTLFDADKVHSAMKSLEAATDDLQSSVGQFDAENWRDVVPNVKTASDDIAGAVAELRTALGYSDSN